MRKYFKRQGNKGTSQFQPKVDSNQINEGQKGQFLEIPMKQMFLRKAVYH